MISLIICSVNDGYLQTLKQNIEKNIGVEHEWLIWDNKQKQVGLCEVYNTMAEKAKYPFVCFLHEDITIDTPGWGTLLIGIAKERNDVGLIGVAGGKYKSARYSGWYSGGNQLDYYSITHHLNGKVEKLNAPEKWEKNEVQVAAIDGVFMFGKKEIWREVRFNDLLLKGFHYYDIDFSMRVAAKYRVLVTNRLEIVHYTKGGDYGDKWVNETIAFHQASRNSLPFSVDVNIQKDIDFLVAEYWLDWLKNMNISMVNRCNWIKNQRLYNHFSLWYSILKFALYKPLGLKKIHHFFKTK